MLGVVRSEGVIESVGFAVYVVHSQHAHIQRGLRSRLRFLPCRCLNTRSQRLERDYWILGL